MVRQQKLELAFSERIANPGLIAMSNAAMEIAETIQTASIKRSPSPRHDINPSTAASAKEPVTLSSSPHSHSDIEEDEIPYSVIRPEPRRAQLPPLPDLRFEQSYLASISKAETGGMVFWITLRDQVSQSVARSAQSSPDTGTGNSAVGPRDSLDACTAWLEILE